MRIIVSMYMINIIYSKLWCTKTTSKLNIMRLIRKINGKTKEVFLLVSRPSYTIPKRALNSSSSNCDFLQYKKHSRPKGKMLTTRATRIEVLAPIQSPECELKSRLFTLIVELKCSSKKDS